MSNQSNTSNDKPRTVQEIICAIEAKSADGGYIFRGEPECNDKVSSNLWRELDAAKAKDTDIKAIQDQIVEDAKEYENNKTADEILNDIQHYGGKTNLIDFSTHYDVALFFACYGSPGEDGRVIILQKTEEVKEMLRYPQKPENRVHAQKSVFVEPPKGYIEQNYEVIRIPKDLKLLILQHLREHPPHISPKTIYNDIHGYIRSQKDYWLAYRDFYNGLASQDKANQSRTLEEKQKACKEAIEHYTKALDRNLQLAPVYNNRGSAYNIKGDYDSAIADFTKAMQLTADNIIPYNNRAGAYIDKRDYDSALVDCNKAMELDPDDVEAYNNRGLAHRGKKDYNLAILDFSKAIDLKQDYTIAYNNRGSVYHKKGDSNRAILDFNKAIELEGDYADAYFNRGNAYQKKGDFGRAIEDYDMMIELQPNNAIAHYYRGVAYVIEQEVDRAIEDLDKAIELKPDYAVAYYYRGMVRLHLRELENARLDLTNARNMGADIIASFHSYYESVSDFERRNHVQLPPDIAAMLTPPQA